MSGTPAVVRPGTSLNGESGLAQEPENNQSECDRYTCQGIDRPSACAHDMPQAAMRARTTPSASTVMGENSPFRSSDSQGVDTDVEYLPEPGDPAGIPKVPSNEQPGDHPTWLYLP